MIAMKTYSAIQRQMFAASKDGKKVKVDKAAFEKDIIKRKRRRIVLIIMVLFWIVAAAVIISLAAFDKLPESLMSILGSSGMGTIGVAGGVYVAATWTLCWVGFPVGWNLWASDRLEAKSQAYVTIVIDEHGYVDTKVDKLSPKIGALIMSIIGGALTM